MPSLSGSIPLEEAAFLVIQLVRGIAKYESSGIKWRVQACSYTLKLWNFALLIMCLGLCKWLICGRRVGNVISVCPRMHVLVDLKIAILPWYRHHVHVLLATMNNYSTSLEARGYYVVHEVSFN